MIRKLVFRLCQVDPGPRRLSSRESGTFRRRHRPDQAGPSHPDEVGFVRFSKVGAELLFGLLTDRYERGSVLVTFGASF